MMIKQLANEIDEQTAWHAAMIAFANRTARHLADHHGVGATDDLRENAARHLEAHGVNRHARLPTELRHVLLPLHELKPPRNTTARMHDHPR